MMKLSRNRWIVLSRVAAVIIFAVLVGLVPSCCAKKEQPAPVPTTTPVPTATGVGLPTATVTGAASATPTATGVDNPTSTTPPAPTTNVSVTATATPQSTITVGPNTTHFDQPVYNVQVGGNDFEVVVLWSGGNESYFVSGQFDLHYDSSLITLVSGTYGLMYDNGAGVAAGTRGQTNGTVSGDIMYAFTNGDWSQYILEEMGGWGFTEPGWWIRYTFTTNATNTGTTGLNFSDSRVPLEANMMWDDGLEAENNPYAVWINSTVNVLP